MVTSTGVSRAAAMMLALILASSSGCTAQEGTADPPGAKGEPGAPGAKGQQGEPGSQGDLGLQGAQGLAGPQGAQGLAGLQGAQGSQGVQGPKGDPGSQGPPGPQDLDAPIYAKILMRAKYGDGGWKTYVSGPIGMTCDQICNSIQHPPDCGGVIQCSAMWCDGHAATRANAPTSDPYLSYGCASTGYEGCKPDCMCDNAGCGWSDTSLVLPSGVTFW